MPSPSRLVFALALALAVPARAETARVVIDPGHGGQAMGALGAYGVYEKYVTLAVATRLGRLLESEPGVAVFYTRKEDVFVDLKDRSEVANGLDADVFVSVHCNASPATEANGIETYFLGGEGRDPEADDVATRENAGQAAPEPGDPDLAGILADLKHNGNQGESAALAETIQKRLLAAFPETVSRDVRQANFAVLRRARMPAVVVEVGFMTHSQEGLNLILAPYQERLAAALGDAILRYLKGQRLAPTARR